MRLLLDENVPNPLTSTIKTLLRTSHDVTRILDLDGWSGTKDLSLYDQAAAAGFEVLPTNDAKQMQRQHEVEAVARSRVHRVQYPHRHGGLVGIGVAMATVCAALPSVLDELSDASGQQLVTLTGIDPRPGSRYTVTDPRQDPPKFWPSSGSPRA